MLLRSRRTALPITWRSSLHLRLMALGLTPLLVAFPLIMGILVFIGGERIDAMLADQTRANLASAQNYLAHVRIQALQHIEETVRSERITQQLATHGDKASREANPHLDQILAARADAARLDYLIIATPDGQVIASNTGLAPGSRLPSSFTLRQAATGVATVGYERLDSAALLARSPTLPAQARLETQAGDAAQPPATETRGLVISAATHFPLTNTHPDAVLIGGILLNKNTALIEHMREIIFPVGVLPGDAEGLSGIFVDEQSLVISRQRQPGLRGESLNQGLAVGLAPNQATFCTGCPIHHTVRRGEVAFGTHQPFPCLQGRLLLDQRGCIRYGIAPRQPIGQSGTITGVLCLQIIGQTGQGEAG